MAKPRRRKTLVRAKTRTRTVKRKVARRPARRKRPLRVKRTITRVRPKRKAAPQPSARSVVDKLNLVDYAAAAARMLLEAHPTIVFTSGRRNAEEQASAMASNVIRNRKWVEQTYRKSPERDAVQGWIDNHPEAVTKAAVAAGLAEIMSEWSDKQKRGFSRHFSGQAFDIRPVANGNTIKATIRALPNLRKFLEEEGGLTIWHADFERA